MQQADFACYAAHELRTPRRPSAHCSSWPSPTRTPIWRAGARSARTSSGACRHQERLLDACLALARGRGGLQSSEAVDLAEIAADALRTHDPGALTRVAQLCPAATSGDPVLLERLAANLISNAIRHNVAGGRLAVATRIGSGLRRPLDRQHRCAGPGRRGRPPLPALPTARSSRGRRAGTRDRSGGRRRTRRRHRRTRPGQRRPRDQRGIRRPRTEQARSGLDRRAQSLAAFHARRRRVVADFVNPAWRRTSTVAPWPRSMPGFSDGAGSPRPGLVGRGAG